MLDLGDDLRRAAPEAAAWLDDKLNALRQGEGRLDVLLPQLPRRVGRTHFPAELREADGVTIDLGAWRTCDAAASLTIAAAAPDEETLIDLHDHGDIEERTMLSRYIGIAPVDALTRRIFDETQRTNMVGHVVAATLDSNILARVTTAAPAAGFELDDFNRMVLKIAFLDLPLNRCFGATAHANPELSRMLQDLATEREAAGRKVWFDTNEMIGHAPTDGTLARLIGGLENGVVEHRISAARGIAATGRTELAEYLHGRTDREIAPAVRDAVQQALEMLGPS